VKESQNCKGLTTNSFFLHTSDFIQNNKKDNLLIIIMLRQISYRLVLTGDLNSLLYAIEKYSSLLVIGTLLFYDNVYVMMYNIILFNKKFKKKIICLVKNIYFFAYVRLNSK